MCKSCQHKYVGNMNQYKHLHGSGRITLADLIAGMKKVPIIGTAVKALSEQKKRIEGKPSKPSIIDPQED